MNRKAVVFALTCCLVCVFAGACLAAEEGPNDQEAPPHKGDLAIGLIAMGAALAVGLCAVGTGIAQSRIGAAGCGTIAERPETVGTVILLVAIPETMVILGFVVAIVMLFML